MALVAAGVVEAAVVIEAAGVVLEVVEVVS